MTNINFYVSQQAGWDNRLDIAYKLITIALQRKLAIHIHTDDEKDSRSIDDYLWRKQRSSFIPHAVISDDFHQTEEKSPLEISISHDYEPMKDCDYLINLSQERPNFFSRYVKFAEIIDQSEEILTAGRKRYAFYRDRGYTLEYYQL